MRKTARPQTNGANRAQAAAPGDAGPDQADKPHEQEGVIDDVGDLGDNRQIAHRLHLSERTAENHVAHIMTKLGFDSRARIAAWYAARGGEG
jgi:non-specific serine/threonine protein kinase